MINKLTKKQEAQIPKFIEKYVKLAEKPTDRKKATLAVQALYKSAGEDKPIVIFAESPFATAVMVAMTRILFKDKKLASDDSQLYSQLYSQLGSQLDSQLDSQLRSQLGSQLDSQLDSQLGSQLYSQLDSQLRSQLGSQLYSQLGSQLDSQLYSQLYSQLKNVNNDWWLIVWWLVWAGWYAYGEYIGVKFDNKVLKIFMDFVTNVSFIIPYKGIAFVSETPQIKWSEGRLHNPEGKSVEYKDGQGLYSWKGTAVTQKMIETPEKITKQDILKEQNAEVRRCIREKLGDEKFAKKLGIKILHKGKRGVLYKTKEKDDLKDDYLYFVRVVCPTTKRVYFLGVPEFANADDAISWTFGKTKETYQPLIEA